MDSLSDILSAAIGERRVVEIHYGRETSPRKVAPHALFRTASGHLLLSGVEMADPALGWDAYRPKNYDLRQLTAAAVTDHRFTPDPAFDPADRRFRHGIVRTVPLDAGER
ncbi:MAG: WYL domain-containing protein [Leptospirillia bacterium]